MCNLKTVFCPTCHVFVIGYIRTNKGIQLIKNGKRIGATFSGNKHMNKYGKWENGLIIRCPNGHTVLISDESNTSDENPPGIIEPPKFSFGKVCFYHDMPGTVCNIHKECITCIVYHNYKEASQCQLTM
jgi:hypothetical protein